MTPTEMFVSRIEAKAGEKATERATGVWAARCPVHGDEMASLWIRDHHPKGFFVKCSAGCEADDILDAVGMTRDHMVGRAEKKEKLRLGDPGVEETFFDYLGESGELEFQKVRLDHPDTKRKTFFIRRRVKGAWKIGIGEARPVPYRLPELLRASSVYLVEGEKVALRLVSEGFVATTLPDGASSRWHPQYAEFFRGKKVAILPDIDKAGREYARRLVLELGQVVTELRVVELPGLKDGEDAYDWFARGGTRQELERLVRETAPTKATAIPRKFSLTEDGNAERLVHFHGQDLRYVATSKTHGAWFHWDGIRWQEDEDCGVTYSRARDVIHRLEDEAELAVGEESTLYRRHIKSTGRAAAMSNMIFLARRRAPIKTPRLKLDDPEATCWYFAAQNGIVDLRTGALIPPSRDLLITRRAAVAFNPEAKSPRWERFLEEILDGKRDEIQFLQRWFGSSLSGSVEDQKFCVFFGSGSNGKGKCAHTVREVLGTYARPADIGTFQDVKGRGGGHRDDLASLQPARMVVASEPNDGSVLDESVVKQISGEDPITASHKGEKTITFDPQFKLTLLANYKPKIRGTNHGIWRRVMLVPFTQTFPVEHMLKAELASEREGILRWLVEGCLDWQRHQLQVPRRIEDATKEYRNDMDPLSGFLEDCCVMKSTVQLPLRWLFTVYKRWAEEADEIRLRDVRRFRGLLQQREGLRTYTDGGRDYIHGLVLKPHALQDVALKPKERETLEQIIRHAEHPADAPYL